ncbi:hypothetical protein LCGC14_1432360 [marine sediment metagenome]|uniref:Uncharacterized protein n=1 Tax=marine sediment metagenome TaxID=412755 RepID=A0A0F9M3S8_9ZZZZ
MPSSRPTLFCTIAVRDPQGRVTRRRRFRSRSFLQQWNRLIAAQVLWTTITIKDVDNVDKSVTQATWNFRMNGGAADPSRGIVIGTGTTAVAIGDYKLEALIPEGAGAGQMNYQACSVAMPVIAAPYCSFKVARVVTNNSGDTITVKELGVYAVMLVPGNPSGCVIRDVLGTPLDVLDGGSISVDYTIRVQA